MAEAVARHVLSAQVSDLSTIGREVTSGGAHGLPGNPATAHMQAAAAEIGLDLPGHRSTQIEPNMLEEAAVVYAMEADPVAWIRLHCSDAHGALVGRTNIKDRYGLSPAGYRRGEARDRRGRPAARTRRDRPGELICSGAARV